MKLTVLLFHLSWSVVCLYVRSGAASSDVLKLSFVREQNFLTTYTLSGAHINMNFNRRIMQNIRSKTDFLRNEKKKKTISLWKKKKHVKNDNVHNQFNGGGVAYFYTQFSCLTNRFSCCLVMSCAQFVFYIHTFFWLKTLILFSFWA